jgi:hypothetical protein
VQKYLERPLLYRGRKFDIRVWVLLTQRREIYFYQEGYIRTSSAEYQLETLNSETHLTNNILQKTFPEYSKHEPGNILPLTILQEYLPLLDERYQHFRLETITERMHDLTVDALLAAKQIAFCNHRIEFELFGLDFMVDEDLRTWLIEVNVNPSLSVANEYLEKLLPRMVDDMFKLVLDPSFPPANSTPTPHNFKLLYSDSVNLRRPFKTSLYPIPELAPPLNRPPEDERRVLRELTLEDTISSMLEAVIFIEFGPFIPYVSKLVNKLACYQLLLDKDLLSYCNTLALVAKSKVSGILLE